MLADSDFPLHWSEISMDDGRPLLLTFLEQEGSLFLRFVKTDEGLWAEGAVAICAKGSELEARVAPRKMRLGPAAHWTMHYVAASGVDFTFTRPGATRVKLETTGWSGTFSPRR